MQINTILRTLKPCERFNSDQFEQVGLVAINEPLELGNNYSLENLATALYENLSADNFMLLYQSCLDGIKISYKTRYGKGCLNLCGFDFACYFKDYYDSIQYELKTDSFYKVL
tara:strand:+ start:1495 stop:1833 length:339 start_codon:yes stop_codon:yes gene_type:complete